MKYLVIFFIVCFMSGVHSFVPASVMSQVLYKLDGRFEGNLGRVSESLTHDEIVKRGLIQSVVAYLKTQPGGNNVNISKMNDYYDVRNLYYDFYGKGLCNDNIPFYTTVEEMKKDTASVDFTSYTKDLPYAHFDAEAFYESNERVIEFKRQVNFDIKYNDFDEARKKSGQILHTIQDFYSHSNWVEMGHTDLSVLIGTTNFNGLGTSKEIDTVCDNSTVKCQLITEKCGLIASVVSSVINGLGLGGTYVTCPLRYYNCTDNIVVKDKLASGYYTGQETNDGVEVEKPPKKLKCSHGGVLDGSSFISAEGGINKDSGYTLFSPHAMLHLKAADLAIAHTKKWFDDILTEFGSDKFDRFLSLKIDNATLSKFGNVSCTSNMLTINVQILVSILFANVLLYHLN